jgi:light-regulated signal transduction histidine kinase (bacteriophytochrome)
MRRLIDDLLRLSKASSRPLDRVDVDLEQVMRNVVDDLSGMLEDSQGKVEWRGLPHVPGDEGQLRELLQNLVANSIKFRDPARPPEVRIWAEAESGRVTLHVDDNGIGFDPACSENLFAPFKRLHSGSRYPGTGMGLAIVHRIVERHHGNIRVAAEPGRGARFTVVLPGLETEESHEGQATDHPAGRR